MNKNIPRENQCKRVEARLHDLIDYVYEYAHRKRLTRAPFNAYYALEEEWENYPKKWEEAVIAMLAATAVLGNQKKTAAFIRSIKNQLTEVELSLFKRWRSHPWFYSAFTVTKELDEHFVEARPIGDPPAAWPEGEMPESLIIYSPRISDEYRHGSRIFIALLWEGEQAFHTYGAFLPFQSLNENDLRYFTDVIQTKDLSASSCPIKGIPERGSAVSDTIMQEPLSFLRLLSLSSTPRMQGPKGELSACASVVQVTDVDSLGDESKWRKAAQSAGEKVFQVLIEEDEKNEMRAGAVYFDEGELMHAPRIYISFDTSRIFLSSFTEETYRRGRKAAEPLCSFPEQPQSKASIPIAAKARQILEYQDELTNLQSLLEEMPVDEEEAPGIDGEGSAEDNLPTKDELDAIAQRIMENHNEGVEEDDESFAQAVGMDVSKIAPIREQLKSKIESMGGGSEKAADRFGLSPKDFRKLTQERIPEVEGVLRLKTPEEVQVSAEQEGHDLLQLFSVSPAYRFTRWLTEKVLENGSLPATQAGYVQTKYIREALEKRIIPSPADLMEELKPKKEADWTEFHSLRTLLETAQIIAFDGKRFLPGKGSDELLDNPAELYHHLFTVLCTGYEWDTLPHTGPLPYVRELMPFLLYAIRKLSHEAREAQKENDEGWFSSELLFQRFIAAAPPLAAELKKEEKYYGNGERGFGIREALKIGMQIAFLRNLAERLGLVEIKTNEELPEDMQIRPTPLFSVVFE